MLIEGLQYMVIGMSVVFSFLIIMIILMYISAYLIKIYNNMFPEIVEDHSKATSVVSSNDDIAVVIAAVRAHTTV